MSKKNRFTVRPLLQEEESLFGFLLRYSTANSISLCDILNKYKISKYNLHSGDFHKIDSIPESIIDLEKLSFDTKTPREKLRACSFYNIVLKFKGSSKDYHSQFLKGYFRSILHYCPDCFKDKRILRLAWKFDSIIICERHQRPLLEACHSCQNTIQYKDMQKVSLCPHCLNDLSKSKDIEPVSSIPDQIKSDQEWYKSALLNLSKNHLDIQLHQSELAMKILYILNGCKLEFNRKETRNKVKEATLIHYLQCARGTTQKSTLHLRSILSILKVHSVEVGTFLELEVPTEFVASILNPNKVEKKIYTCIAPWCLSYGLEGRLLTTPSKNIQQHGQILKQYYVCSDCGCEYASDVNNSMIERTNFIKGYEILSKRNVKNLTWPERENLFGIKRNKILRILSYFSSREIFSDQFKYGEEDISDERIMEFIESIHSGEKIYDIRYWKCWGNYELYLLHRYHPKVIKAIIKNINLPSANSVCDENLAKQINNIFSRMIEESEEIKLFSVAKAVGCCATTIRNKGCSEIVSEFRKMQQRLFRKEIINKVERNIDEFFIQHEGGKILSKELFNNLDVCRGTIRKIQPDFCKEIDRRRTEWNGIEELKEDKRII
ncbi:TniQ family protein [Paenibacillus sp. NPDC058177]|uniref:TniQ family protein n=1 Tax=Paenibacillus sp. NPDC058177 TaxID=3346369 RepID=UPI0036DA9221